MVVSDIRMPGLPGLELMQQLKAAPAVHAGDHHDGVLGPGERRRRLPGRRLRIPAQALRRRPRGGARAPRDRREPPPGRSAAGRRARRPRSSARRPRCRKCSAPSAASRSRTRRCSSPANRAPARSSSRARCIATARAPQRAFIAINTAAIPKDLLESELFGHERGAFTGAQAMRRGRFEQAEGGTLFLDEIGDMPPDLQTRLLRVLSDGQFYRVGGHTPLAANVRVIAATHQDLEARVKQGLFREDLYHRLNVIRLRLPALRERREDIPMLARHFLAKSARDLGVEGKRLTDAALAVPRRAGLARQRAPAREPLPLGHGDGAGPGGRREGPAAGSARRRPAPRRRRRRLAARAGARSGRAARARRIAASPTRSRAISSPRSSRRRCSTRAGGASRRRACSASGATRSRARCRSSRSTPKD